MERRVHTCLASAPYRFFCFFFPTQANISSPVLTTFDFCVAPPFGAWHPYIHPCLCWAFLNSKDCLTSRLKVWRLFSDKVPLGSREGSGTLWLSPVQHLPYSSTQGQNGSHARPQGLPLSRAGSCTTSIQQAAELASHREPRRWPHGWRLGAPSCRHHVPCAVMCVTTFPVLLSFSTILNKEIKVIYAYQVPTLTHLHESHLLCPRPPCLSQEGGHLWHTR